MGVALIVIGVAAAGLVWPTIERLLRGLPRTNQDWHFF
jgi:hypothetical protein